MTAGTFLKPILVSVYPLTPMCCRAGSVWQCPLTQAAGDCSPIHDIVPGSSQPPSRDEMRSDQWLGAAVTSAGPGGKVNIFATINIFT